MGDVPVVTDRKTRRRDPLGLTAHDVILHVGFPKASPTVTAVWDAPRAPGGDIRRPGVVPDDLWTAAIDVETSRALSRAWRAAGGR